MSQVMILDPDTQYTIFGAPGFPEAATPMLMGLALTDILLDGAR